MAKTIVPNFNYAVPTLDHVKLVPYIDFPIVYDDTVTERAFYVNAPFAFATSNPDNTTLLKWNGIGWTVITGWANPDKIDSRGFFAFTTDIDTYITISEDEN